MSESNKSQRCAANTRAGTACKNFARPDSVYCQVHQPHPAATAAGTPAVEPPPAVDAAQLRQELAHELDELVHRLRQTFPEFEPAPFSPHALFDQFRQFMPHFPARLQPEFLQRLRTSFSEDLFDVETWRGLWYVISYTLQHQAGFFKRRLTGEYETDEWGLDWEFVELVRPFFEFLYYRYWRIEINGLEHIPNAGRALLICNHSGQLPWDGAMLATGIFNEHPSGRLMRSLYASWFPTLPFFSTILERGGQVLATVENGVRLLEQDELVAVFPEGVKGIGKLFKDRYRLARFGRGGFVRMALATGSPLIPVSIVGAEETYISLAKSDFIAKLIGFPFFPISTTWPWLGLLGFVPLPTKWYLDIGEPIAMQDYEPDAAQNLVLVSQLTDQVRNVVQQMIIDRLSQRRSVFFG